MLFQLQFPEMFLRLIWTQKIIIKTRTITGVKRGRRDAQKPRADPKAAELDLKFGTESWEEAHVIIENK